MAISSNNPVKLTTTGERVALAAAAAAEAGERVPDYHLRFTGPQVDEAIQKILSLNLDAISTITIHELTIPKNGWTLTESGGRYPYSIEVDCESAIARHVPQVTLDEASEDIAALCGLAPACETLSRKLKFKAVVPPTEEMNGILTLILSSGGAYVTDENDEPVDSSTLVAIRRVGDGLIITNDGVIKVDTDRVMTDDDMADEEQLAKDIKDALNAAASQPTD